MEVRSRKQLLLKGVVHELSQHLVKRQFGATFWRGRRIKEFKNGLDQFMGGGTPIAD